MFENDKLEESLKENSCHTQEELAELFGVDRITVSKRIYALGMTLKEGHCGMN